MNVTLYTFSKKHNSTAVPTGGTSVDVVLKDEAGVLDPIIELHTSASPSAYNYLYIPTFGRYYWLREWTYNRGIWTGSFYADPLASWKTQIGAQQLYVFRSAAEWDGRITDTYYPTVADPEFTIIDLPALWTTTQASAAAAIHTGRYIVGIISDRSSLTTYYAFTESDMESFMGGLFNDHYYETVLGTTTLTPELKAQVNPVEYIVSCRYWPAGFLAGSSSSVVQFQGVYGGSNIYVGKGYVPIDGSIPGAGSALTGSVLLFGGGKHLTYYTQPIDISSITHPQQAARGIFLRSAPYTTWELFYPPFGLIELDSTDLIEATSIIMGVGLDIRAGTGSLDVYASDGTTNKLIARTLSPVAVDVPIHGIMQTGTGPVNLFAPALSAAASLAHGDLMGAAQFTQRAVGAFVSGKVPHLSATGSVGSSSGMSGSPKLIVTHQMVANDDLTGRGRPLCAKRTLSALPGYIMADPDELSIVATARELEEIRGFISGGFFYE